MAVTREQYIIQSVEDYLRRQLFDVRGYPEDRIGVKDSFNGKPIEDVERLSKNWIAVGYNFDDGGRGAELGSTLTQRVYTIEFFVFGQTSTWGKNLAHAIKFSLEHDKRIPLVDILADGRPETDEILEVNSVQAQEQAVRDPAPWQENVWLVTLKVQDYYFSNVV